MPPLKRPNKISHVYHLLSNAETEILGYPPRMLANSSNAVLEKRRAYFLFSYNIQFIVWWGIKQNMDDIN